MSKLWVSFLALAKIPIHLPPAESNKIESLPKIIFAHKQYVKNGASLIYD